MYRYGDTACEHEIQKKRKGRGSSGVTNPASANSGMLRPRHEFLSSASSKSTNAIFQRARKELREFAAIHNINAPEEVDKNFSLLVFNLLADLCKFATPEALKDSTMGGYIQGLRMAYEECGNHQAWVLDDQTGEAKGNTLIGNPDIVDLRKAHRVHLARFGSITLRARPITADHICQHAEKFWFGSQAIVDIRDIMLHAVLVLGVNMGLRYEEIAKLQTDHISIVEGKTVLTLSVAIKNSTEQRNYMLREWPGNSALGHSLFMDPTTALLSWMVRRGSRPGPLFCDITNVRSGHILDTSKSWPATKFKSFLRERLKDIGVGHADLVMYAGHSIKRGFVQLYRSLGLRDEMIMEIIQMKGFQAYLNYCSAYKDCAPPDMTRFANVHDLISHVVAISNESDFIQDEKTFEAFMREVEGSQDDEE